MTACNEAKTVYWHTQYNIDKPPAKPDPRFVRFVVISDTHSTQPQVPLGDVLLHSGDLTDLGSEAAFAEQLKWLKNLPHAQKYIIAGNHDFGLCDDDDWYSKRGELLHARHGFQTADVAKIKVLMDDWQKDVKDGQIHRYVKDERLEFEAGGRTWSLFGSPWSPEFGRWAWNYKRGQEAKDLYSSLPSTDILLTHTPPHELGHLDVLTDGKTSVGCEELTERLRSGAIRPLLHCFGHIHEARGAHLETWQKANEAGRSETLLINASIVEMDKTSVYMDAAIKMPLIHATQWIGVERKGWLQMSFKYKVENLPIIVDIDPSAA